jgi:hypothetical protein
MLRWAYRVNSRFRQWCPYAVWRRCSVARRMSERNKRKNIEKITG